MKLKLIAIALIALLVLTVVPMTISAASAAPRMVRSDLYIVNRVGETWIVGDRVGFVVYNTETGFFVINARGLAAELSYRLGATSGPISTGDTFKGGTGAALLYTDARGTIHTTGYVYEEHVAEIGNIIVNKEGSFYIAHNLS